MYATATEAIETLRQNDPAITSIRILWVGETPEADLAQALEQNPFVTDITLNLFGVERTDWDSLLRVIATRVNLEEVELRDGGTRQRVPPGTNTEPAMFVPAALVRSILRAMQQNTAILRVKLTGLCLPTNISTFLNNASSIISFRLSECTMEPAGRDQGARELAVALDRNTNTKRLELFELEDICTLRVLEGLRSNTSVKTLFLSPGRSFSDAAAHALQHLLESTTSIQRFELYSYDDLWGNNLVRQIAQGIINSECVSELKFAGCLFQGRNNFAQLQSILQNKQNLTSLCLCSCFFGGEQVHGDILSILSRPNSLLRCFELIYSVTGRLKQTIPYIQFKNLLQAIEKSKLERFQIGSIDDPDYFEALTQSIPSMKLKELEVKLLADEDSDDEDEEVMSNREFIRQELLHALKNNFSLGSVKAELSETDLFDNDDKQTLAFYANRNVRLDQWADNPETVEHQKVWPNALGLAERAGPSALFRGLRSVLERDYVSVPGSRKRKRPQH